MAEIWFGTHPGSMTKVAGNGTLLELRNQEPLPFLFKILAAGSPLSIQAHPNPQQAIDGFAAENAAGVPLDASHRNYKDDKHKPEMLVALTDFRLSLIHI
jgi:mannose-6-phosphate isomerase